MKKLMSARGGSVLGGKKVIGIDIGGTKILGVIWDGKKVLDELTIVTPKTRFEFERNLLKLVDFLSAKEKIGGIGIGCAGRVNPLTGMARLSGNLKFKAEINLVKLFKDRYKLPVEIDNDSNCFTRAEMLIGQGKDLSNFLGIIMGTGMGGGIVLNRKIYRGERNSGAEFGHMVLDRGFLEKVYFQPAAQNRNYKQLALVAGRAFAGLINIFAPQAIILGGGVSLNVGNKFLPGAKKEMKKFVFDPELETKILVSKIKNAGAIGAALLLK